MIGKLEQTLVYQFRNKETLMRAITHRSYAHQENLPSDNEKLEFLGDAVLDLLLAEELIRHFPNCSEGDLSKRRASLVNTEMLAELALKLQLDQCIQLSKGEMQTGGNKKPRLLACAYEALLGAIYTDGGLEACRQRVIRDYGELLAQPMEGDIYLKDFKSKLQELAQKQFQKIPDYEVLGEQGPSHERVFSVQVSFDGKILALGEGKSKKVAEQQAAEKAIPIFQDWIAQKQKGFVSQRSEP